MAMEPITLFSRSVDPAGVARRLRELAPDIEIDAPDDRWTRAVVAYGTGTKRRALTFTHDPAYYAEPNWSTQMAGMRGYFAGFPDTDRREQVLLLTTSLQFSLGTLFEPDFDAEGDPRLDVLFEIAKLLDGVLFTPSSLRDARGRVLFSAGGEDNEDPEAVWPRVRGEVTLSEPLGEWMHEQSRPRPAEEYEETAEAPSPMRVARRALALTAVTIRAILEQDAGEPAAADTYQNLLAWLEDVKVGDELEPDEWEVLQRPLGRLDPDMQVNSSWRLEGLVVLAWALGRFEVPPHDRLVELQPLWQSLGGFDYEAAEALLADSQLRPLEEIAALRNRLFAVHWRLRNFHLNCEVLDFADFARTCWFGPLDITGLPLVDGDLALQGERLDRAADEVFSAAHSAAQERHQAVNWLLEGPEQYSEASVAT
jgi:hypothetical protein